MVEFRVRPRLAGVAQLVEQLIRNQQVTRSSRVAGSNLRSWIKRATVGKSPRLAHRSASRERGLPCPRLLTPTLTHR